MYVSRPEYQRQLLLLGKALVFYFVLSVLVDSSSATEVIESILSPFLVFDFQ